MIAGWVVTESGRQPWIAHGILRTADAISPVAASHVLTTLILFVVVYGIVFTMGIYYINRLIEKGPQGRRRRARAKTFSAEPDRSPRATQAARSARRRSHRHRAETQEADHGMVSAGDLGGADRHRGRALRHVSTASISASASCFRPRSRRPSATR